MSETLTETAATTVPIMATEATIPVAQHDAPHYILRLTEAAENSLEEARANAIDAEDFANLQEEILLMEEQAKSQKNKSEQNMARIQRSTRVLQSKISRATKAAEKSAAAVADFERDAKPKRENFQSERTFLLAMQAYYVKLKKLHDVQKNVEEVTIASQTWMSKIMDTLTWVAQKLVEMVHAAIDVVMKFAREAADLIQKVFDEVIEFFKSITF